MTDSPLLVSTALFFHLFTLICFASRYPFSLFLVSIAHFSFISFSLYLSLSCLLFTMSLRSCYKVALSLISVLHVDTGVGAPYDPVTTPEGASVLAAVLHSKAVDWTDAN